jgi:S1-C subfamily serine protease
MLALDEMPLRQPDDLVSVLGPDHIGTSVTAQLLRGGEVRSVQVMLSERIQGPAERTG